MYCCMRRGGQRTCGQRSTRFSSARTVRPPVSSAKVLSPRAVMAWEEVGLRTTPSPMNVVVVNERRAENVPPPPPRRRGNCRSFAQKTDVRQVSPTPSLTTTAAAARSHNEQLPPAGSRSSIPALSASVPMPRQKPRVPVQVTTLKGRGASSASGPTFSGRSRGERRAWGWSISSFHSSSLFRRGNLS